ncbi:hypothetical protein [Hymenobacter bucti]|uniref:DUF3445 domain-containing protein n=1 Tax=Hymenobacter bucti TaxID=1844114 RepID=A0ABW4QZ43_9BACT
MASSPPLTGFFLDELTLPWGTTLAEAAARLAGRPQWPPYGGWPNLRPACSHVLGLAATGCDLRAPAHARPVLHASYHLAAPPHYAGQPAEASQWQEPLTAQLGPPTQAEVMERPGVTGSSMVVYAAHWQWPGVRLSLAAYGGARPEAGGPVGASLFLDWEDEQTAAHPYAVAAAREAALLAAVAGPAVAATVFHLTQAQVPYTHFNFGEPRPPNDERRRVQRALYREHLLETPPYFQQRLAAAEVALWPVPGRAAWAVSTRWDTLVLPVAAPPRIELLTAQPGRGPGYVQLDIGTLRLTDALAAPALPALASALARLPGVIVGRREDYDGW